MHYMYNTFEFVAVCEPSRSSRSRKTNWFSSQLQRTLPPLFSSLRLPRISAQVCVNARASTCLHMRMLLRASAIRDEADGWRFSLYRRHQKPGSEETVEWTVSLDVSPNCLSLSLHFCPFCHSLGQPQLLGWFRYYRLCIEMALVWSPRLMRLMRALSFAVCDSVFSRRTRRERRQAMMCMRNCRHKLGVRGSHSGFGIIGIGMHKICNRYASGQDDSHRLLSIRTEWTDFGLESRSCLLVIQTATSRNILQ